MVPPLPASALFTQPAPLEQGDVEDLPEERFYSDVLAGVKEEEAVAHEEIAQREEEEELIEQLDAQREAEAAALASTLSPIVPEVRPMKVVPNYDAMKKEELAKLAEQRGLRVKRTSGKGEIIALLRKNDANNTTVSGVAENVSEPVTSMLAAPTDDANGFPLDLDEST
jgi:hypothetical protein